MRETEPLPRHALKLYSLFVLYFLLVRGPMSGYEIAQLIKEHSHGQFKATAGNVYPRLHELKEAGDVRAREPIGGREKIVYEITEQGKQTLREGALEKRPLVAGLLKTIDHVLALSGP
ncbi:MAG: PadR family transcriptional regulator [Halobacteriota archaeon]